MVPRLVDRMRHVGGAEQSGEDVVVDVFLGAALVESTVEEEGDVTLEPEE